MRWFGFWTLKHLWLLTWSERALWFSGHFQRFVAGSILPLRFSLAGIRIIPSFLYDYCLPSGFLGLSYICDNVCILSTHVKHHCYCLSLSAQATHHSHCRIWYSLAYTCSELYVLSSTSLWSVFPFGSLANSANRNQSFEIGCPVNSLRTKSTSIDWQTTASKDGPCHS